MVSRYQSDPAGVRRISGPLLDRIDIHIDVPRVEADPAGRTTSCPASGWVNRRPCFGPSRHHPGAGRASVGAPAAAFQGYQAAVQRRRPCAARVGPAEVREYGRLDEAGRSLLKAAMQQLHMSARAYHRILKLARTIAA
jgi:magnesium chelatase family protein